MSLLQLAPLVVSEQDERIQAKQKPRHGRWTLPGAGEPYETCGKSRWEFCDNSDSQEHAGRGDLYRRHRCSCGRAECSTDYEVWASKEAHSIVHRFSVWREIWPKIHPRVRFVPKHVVVSVAKEDCDLPYDKMKAKAKRISKICGVVGACWIFHPFRWRCDRCHKDDDNCECELPTGEWYYSPHFHLIAIGWIKATAQTEGETKWVVVNLGKRESDAEIYRTAQYQLSHAGVWMPEEPEPLRRMLPVEKSNMQGQSTLDHKKARRAAQRKIRRAGGGKRASIFWTGEASYSKLHVEKEEFDGGCVACGRKMKPAPWAGGDDLPPLLLDAIIRNNADEFFLPVEARQVITDQVIEMERRAFLERPGGPPVHLTPHPCAVCGDPSPLNVHVKKDPWGRKMGYLCDAHSIRRPG